MLSGTSRHLPVALMAAALVVAGAVPAQADPDQDQKFFDLLGQKEIPPVDNANSLITSARHACEKLDSGMPVGDLVEQVRNNGFNDNPLTRLQPQDRITRTITLFITASVEAYCPYNRGKIAAIAGYHSSRPRIALVSLAIHAGEIAPTKPLPVPAQQPSVPQEISPPRQQEPPPQRVQPARPQAPPQRVESPPPEAPAPEAPAPESPAPAPGGSPGGGSAPASPTPDQPAGPPGHIRLAP